ncbi:MAG: hypothetical protein HKO57_09690 [Akkermansiaceae bacterium]|nr:hypothetical protein [Akkermansiaceae bacterium]
MTRAPACLLALAASLVGLSAAAQEPAAPAAAVPANEIAALQQELAGAGGTSSSTRQRRAYKSVVRDGEELLEGSPAAPNRWRVLEIVFQSQKRLLGLENSEDNRDALLATCAKLAKAPDEVADLRLEADMLLSERDLSAGNADVNERAEALAELIARYRDTPGEVKSLLMAALIAPKLDAFELEQEIHRTLDDRFPGDHDVIEWRRGHRDFSHLPVQFSGSFTRADGVSLRFPVDLLGQTFLISFWSKATPEIGRHFDEIKELQSRFPGHFEVCSFNLDESPDAGEKMLRARGLDWTALHLPGGRRSQVYRAYAGHDPLAIRVNAHGHAHVSATQLRVIAEETLMEQNFDDPRYLAQLQSLLIGDFLVTGPAPGNPPERAPGSVPADVLDAIRDCFIAVPFRYRLTRAEALASYEKAETLARDAITRHPKAPDLWQVRNLRIIALLGMWKLAAEPKYLEAAGKEARAALAATLPRGAGVVPHFCLAKDSVRRGDSNARAVLSGLIEATGGEDAPGSAYAAAAIVAMDANDRSLHAQYREKVLATPGDDPSLWPVVSFMRDQNHRYRLFKPNLYLPPSRGRRAVRGNLRSNAAALDAVAETGGPLEAEFHTLAGGKLTFPRATDGKLTLLMFVEPPSDPGAEFPTLINGATTVDSRGREVKTLGVMQHAFEFADQHVHQGLQVIPVFLSEDRARVQALVEKHQWPGQAVTVPGGLGNPLVRRLGILSADRVPNVVLLCPDGSVAWKLSGLVHPQVRSEGIGETLHVISRAMKTNIDRFEMENSLGALENGDLDEAIRLFSGPFPTPERPSADGWTAPRLHGRAIAHMGLKNWDAALADLDAAIEAHQWAFNSRKPCPCQQVARLLLTRATALEHLGRAQEAEEARQQAAAAKNSHGPTRYGLLHDRLEALNGKGTKENP